MDACRTPAWRLRGALGRRRLSGSSPHHPAHEHEVFDLGDGVMARTPGDDSWGVVGHVLRMHNSFWGWAGDEPTTDEYCTPNAPPTNQSMGCEGCRHR